MGTFKPLEGDLICAPVPELKRNGVMPIGVKQFVNGEWKLLGFQSPEGALVPTAEFTEYWNSLPPPPDFTPPPGKR